MISIAIPAFNEEKNIAAAVAAILAGVKAAGDFPVEIIIVDDGSTDGTPGEIRALERTHPFVRSIRHERNMGFGASFKDAITAAKYPKICLFAGDNITTPYTVMNLLKHRDEADLVVAYCLNTEVRSTFRSGLSTIFNLIYCVVFGVHMKYLQGTPCYPVARLRELNLRTNGPGLLAEINVKLLRGGATFMEIDGYFNPERQINAPIRIYSLAQALGAFLTLVYEIHFGSRSRYGRTPRRIIPAL